MGRDKHYVSVKVLSMVAYGFSFRILGKVWADYQENRNRLVSLIHLSIKLAKVILQVDGALL